MGKNEKIKLGDLCTGIQHLGIPTNDLKKTKTFYQNFGFQAVYETYVEEKKQHVIFMNLKNLTLELYEDKTSMKNGAIDHVALDCADIDQAYEIAVRNGYEILSNHIKGLDFWENGIRFFTVIGPNHEKIELCQKL